MRIRVKFTVDYDLSGDGLSSAELFAEAGAAVGELLEKAQEQGEVVASNVTWVDSGDKVDKPRVDKAPRGDKA